jgi:hypothetical protein
MATSTVELGEAFVTAIKTDLPDLLEDAELDAPDIDTGYRYSSPLFDASGTPCIVVDPDDWENISLGVGKSSVSRERIVKVYAFISGTNAAVIKQILDAYGDLLCKVLEEATISGVASLSVTKCDYYPEGIEESATLRALCLNVKVKQSRAWGDA